MSAMEPFDIITFDCYGTLIDWRRGITQSFSRIARSSGMVLDDEEVLREYARYERQIEGQPYRSYRDVLTQASALAATSLGLPVPPAERRFLPESLSDWLPFDDTNAALERLRSAGFGLGILSNVDDDLLAETRKHFTLDFDLVITAQQVHSYKPGEAHFLAARERIGETRWLHAGQSYFHDMVPTRSLGIPNAWINRQQEPSGSDQAADREFPDMRGFAASMV
jgi:2-haloalkanoic acid dehalogenase type II